MNCIFSFLNEENIASWFVYFFRSLETLNKRQRNKQILLIIFYKKNKVVSYTFDMNVPLPFKFRQVSPA